MSAITRPHSRRALLQGSAGLSIGAALPAILASAEAREADPALTAAQIYMEAHHRWIDAERAADALHDKAAEQFPDIPAGIRLRKRNAEPGDPRPYYLMGHEEVRRFSVSSADEKRRLALMAEHEAQREQVLARFGHPQAEDAAKAASDETDRLLVVLRNTPATTAAGMLAKIRIAAHFDDFMEGADDPESRLVAPVLLASVVADLERLSREAST
jgi:hypothetical protein